MLPTLRSTSFYSASMLVQQKNAMGSSRLNPAAADQGHTTISTYQTHRRFSHFARRRWLFSEDSDRLLDVAWMGADQRGVDETMRIRGQANKWHTQKTSPAAKQVHPQECSSSAVPLRSSLCFQPPRWRNQQLSEKLCRVLPKFVNLGHSMETSASYSP